MRTKAPRDDKVLRPTGRSRYCRAVHHANLDGVDEAILDLLVEDGRRSASEIGRRVSLSPAAAKRRIDRLEARGVIVGYRAVLDHAKLGGQIEAFTELRFVGTTQVDDIDRTVAELPELVESFTIAGDPDALVRLRVTDLDHLKRVIDKIRRSGKVSGTKTLIVLGARSPQKPLAE
jgi:Lrp/AsnC family transcriptional regulator, leucine-responsive regulatory protein